MTPVQLWAFRSYAGSVWTRCWCSSTERDATKAPNINWGGLGNGATGYDLNSLPTAAIERASRYCAMAQPPNTVPTPLPG